MAGIKGSVPWNAGKKLSDEHKKKISESLRGRIGWSQGLTKETDERVRRSSESHKGQVSWNKGLTKETDIRIKKIGEKVSKAQVGIIPWNKGKKRPSFSDEWKRNMGKAHKGKKHSEESKLKMSKNNAMKNPKVREKIRKVMLNGGAIKALCGVKNPSKPQLKLFKFIKKTYPLAELNFPIKIYDGKYYSLDVAVPELKINFEYDEPFWHSHFNGSETKDFFRDENLIERGWCVVRIKGKEELEHVLRGSLI